MTDPLSTISTRNTPQTVAARADQVKNSAGGYVFKLGDEARLRRFLTLGSEGSTYYVGARELSRENAGVVFRMAETKHRELVDEIVTISTQGRAPKANPALFALAIASSVGTPEERGYALNQLTAVARTGTHLFIFARYVEQFRGWGRALRRAVSEWYLEPSPDDLAYQAVKYRQREGWSHRDLLRLAHPVTDEAARRATFEWIVKGAVGEATPRLIDGFLLAQEAKGAPAWAKLVRDYRLSWEMLPDAALGEAKVWDALLDNGMPQTALMRQLPRLTRLGLLPQMGGRTNEVVERLSSHERLVKARVHPMNVLVAARTYGAGHSARGDSSWTPTAKVMDGMDAAFYASFAAVEPTGKRQMLALDVSGSMTAPISNMPLTCREASAALALITASVEPETIIVGFSNGRQTNYGYGRSGNDSDLMHLPISPRQRLGDAISLVSGLPFSGTDCSLPMRAALQEGLEVDTFVVYTDNETWAGNYQHPFQALKAYREKTGIQARSVVVGMTATECSIADPSDPGMLDVAGFDSAVPNLIADFARA